MFDGIIPLIFIAALNHSMLCKWDGTDAFWCVRSYSSTTWAVSHVGNSQPTWSVPPGELIEAADDNVDAAVEIVSFEVAVELAVILNNKQRR